MIPVPDAFVVQRRDEEVGPPEGVNEFRPGFLDGRVVGNRLAEWGAEAIEDGCTQELPALRLWQPVQHFAQQIIDRKGITDRVTLNGMTLMNWEVHSLPFDANYLASLRPADVDTARKGWFFRGVFDLAEAADTFFDMSGYSKGIVWINGHNLGRYWDIGPQKRLYCPAPWLKKGENSIVVFDLHAVTSPPIGGYRTME